MRNPEIILCPFAIAFIHIGAVGRASGTQPRMKIGSILFIGDRRVQVSAAAKPAFRCHKIAGIHVDGWHMRVRHMRNQADSGRKEIGVFRRAMNSFGKFGVKTAAYGGDVHADFLEDLALHHAAYAAAAGGAVMVAPIPWQVFERCVGACFALNGLKCGADAVAQRFKPRARGLLAMI